MSRKLATVRRIHTLLPIEGADMIELALVDGWQCVVKKGEFQVGDLGVYFEIDSFLPETDERYAFLEPRFIVWQDKRGARIKSMKLRKQLSQGLLLPLALYPEVRAVLAELGIKTGYLVGGESDFGRADFEAALAETDFTELLSVEKWEKPLPQNLRGTARGNFPSFIPKTDQERVQNERNLFENHGESIFQETTKMDGSSMTVYHVPRTSIYYDVAAKPMEDGTMPESVTSVCSRNLDLKETADNLFWQIARADQIPEKLERMGRAIAIQGELCGTTIQGNFEGFAPGYHGYFVYDAFDIEAQRYLLPAEVEQLARELGLKHVPVHGYFKLNDIAKDKRDLLDRAEHKGINGKSAEGKVYKHADSSYSFKAISNSYLLKHGE